MSFKVSILGLACLLVAVFATSAEAQRSYPLTGNLRIQIGDGLPIPIGFTAAPNGKVPVVSGARIVQSSGPDPKKMTIPPDAMLFDGPPFNLPVYGLNSKVFQVLTDITIGFPAPNGGPGGLGSGDTFMAGGRTGLPTVTWCPGQSVTASGNPACTDPGKLPPPTGGSHAGNGFLKYTATGAQFGGPMRGRGAGVADIAFPAAVPAPKAPCDHAATFTGPGGKPCVVIFALATPAGTGVVGGPFGVADTSAGTPEPAPGGLRNAAVNAAGVVLSVTSPGLGTGLTNPATSFGGPWTTGMLEVHQSAAVGSAEIFFMTGHDSRVNGVGTISLVAGGLSERTVSGPNANRGWLNLTVGGNTPGLSSWGIGVLAMLLTGAGVWRARRLAAS